MRNLKSLWVCTLVALAAITLQCGSDQGPSGSLTIIPGPVSLEVSSARQFVADYGGITLQARWYVDGIRGGTPEKGVVTAAGRYVAPADVPPGGVVTLRAVALGDTIGGADATITITKPDLTPYIIVSPETSSVWASDSVLFSSQVVSCAGDSVVWSITRVYGNPVNPGDIYDDGLYVAPSAPAFKFAILVTATSVSCPSRVGIATIVVYAPLAEFSVEMEDYTQKYNVSGKPEIEIEGCSKASNGHAVRGMDKPGEWIRVPFTVPATGTYRPYLHYQAYPGNFIGASMEIGDCGPSQGEASFMLEQGTGMG